MSKNNLVYMFLVGCLLWITIVFVFVNIENNNKIKDLQEQVNNALVDDNKLNDYIKNRTKAKDEQDILTKRLNTLNNEVLKVEKQIRCQRAVLSKVEKWDCENENTYNKYTLEVFS